MEKTLEAHSDSSAQMSVAVEEVEKGHAQPMAGLAIKWQGTVRDKHDMSRLGKAQQLRRNFGFFSTVGFAASLMCSWEFICILLQIPLVNGGTATVFWGFVLGVFGFTFVYASLAEMASMAPTSGGQYHWVSEFAPPSCQRFLSYMAGWACALGWQAFMISATHIGGTLIQGLAVLNHPEYVPQRWQGTLMIMAIAVISVQFNTFFVKKLPMLENLLVVLHVLGFFAVVIPLWMMAPRRDATAALMTFENRGGWNSVGLSTMVGMAVPLLCMLGYDCVIHMSEEIRDAARTVPNAIMTSVALNGVTGIAMVVTLAFTAGDIEAVLKTPTKYAFIQIFYDVTKSRAAATVMGGIIVIIFNVATTSVLAATSRQLWSFARDGGTPFARQLASVRPGWFVPLNAVMVSLVLCCLYSLVNIASEVALGAIITLGGSGLYTTYIMSIGCVLLKRLRGQALPECPWSLGRWGAPINIVALMFLLPSYVFVFFPQATPVVATTMNWAVAVYVGVLLFAFVFYFVNGKNYTPPVVKVHHR